MHRQRLETLLAHMKTVAPHKFSISSFVSSEHANLPEDLLNLDNDITACGAGYIPLVFPEWFKWDEICPAPFLIKDSISINQDVRTFLDINFDQYDFLFACWAEAHNPEYGTGVEGMIKRLEHILKGE